MYKVSSDYTKVIYSGGAEHNLYFKYEDSELIDASPYVSSLQSSRRLLDNGSKNFHLDNFVSQSIDLIIHDFELDDLKKEFYFELGTLVNGEYENVPIGYFKIKDNPTTANGKITLKLMDRATNFDFNYDGSEVINANGGKASYKQIILDICSKANIELATPDFPRCDETTGLYDSTIMARVHIMYIAERSSCIPIMGRDGKLYFIPIVKENNNAIEIPEEIINEKFENADRFKISKVVYDSGVTLWTAGDDSADTLYINSSNPYIYNEEDIINIYNDVKDFEVYSINTNTLIGNIAIDPWDFVKFKITNDEGEVVKEIITLGQYDFTFNGKQRQTFDTKIDRLAKATNKTVTGEVVRYKRLKQTIDETNAKLTIVSENVDDNKERIGQLELSSEGFKTSISNVEKGLSDTNKNVDSLSGKIDGVSANFDDFKNNEYVKDKQYIQDQIDGAIQFWNGSDIPTLNNFPANEWETEADKNNHRADIYTVIDDSSTPPKQGKSYRFDKVNGVWQWVELTDNELSAVQALAQQALDKSTQNEKDIGVLNKKTSELEQTDSEIRASVEELNNQYEQDVTLVKTASGDNSIYIEDASEDNAIEYHILGKSEQATRSGKNLYNYKDTTAVAEGIVTDEDGWITISKDNTQGTSTFYSNYFTHDLDLKEDTSYLVVLEVKQVSGNGKLFLTSYTSTAGQIRNNFSFYFNELKSGDIKFNILKSGKDFSFITADVGLRTYVSSTPGQNGSITFRISVLEDTTITPEQFVYEPYGVSPSPDYPSEIKSVKGVENLFDGEIEYGSLVNSTGAPSATNDCVRSKKFIEIEPKKEYTICNDKNYHNYIYEYNDLKEFIKYTPTSDNPFTFRTSENTKYIKFRTISGSLENDLNTKFRLSTEKNIDFTSYVPYGSWLPVNVTGKNLFNINNPLALNYGSGASSSSGTINQDGTISTSRNIFYSRARGTPVILEKNTNYIISIFVNQLESTGLTRGIIELIAYNDDDTYNSIVNSYTFTDIGKTVSFEVNSGDYDKWAVHVSGHFGSGNSGTLTYSQPMVRNATAKEEYEPYKSQQMLIDMNKPNLFDGEMEEGSFNGDGLNARDRVRIRAKNYRNVKPNTYYVISADSNKEIMVSVSYYTMNDYETPRMSYLNWTRINNSCVFKTPNNCNYIRFLFCFPDNSVINVSDVTNIKIYEGISSKPYYELSSINDTRDSLEVVSGKFTKKIGEYIFTGEESFSTYSGTFYFNIPFPINKSMLNGYSNQYKFVNPISSGAQLIENYTIAFLNDANRIYIKDNRFTTVDDFKTWLKQQYDNGTPVTIYYELETPQTYQLTPTNIPLYENINHINLVSDISTNTSITYLTNSKFNSLYATKAELKVTADSITSEVNKKVSTDDFTTKVSELDSKITQTADNIKSEVSATYSTKAETTQAKNDAISSANTATDNKLKSYSTTTQMNSAIDQKADEITTSVSKTYSTKTETTQAKNDAISSANTATDNKLKNYTNTTDMNQAIQDASDALSTTLVEKIEELDSKFTVSTNEISASVSSRTTELEKKINDVNNNLSDYAKEEVVNQKINQVESRMTSTDAQLTILSETVQKGATKVQTTTGFTFDETGLNIGSSNSKVDNTLTPNGMEIEETSTGDTLLFAGYDTTTNETIVKTKNLTVDKYLIAPNLRIESFKNPNVNKTGTGFFHIE